MADNEQTERNIQAGSEPITGAHNTRPDAAGAATPVQTGLGYSGEFRLAERITLRVTGAGSVELLKANDPTPVSVSDGELAALLDDKYFKKVDTDL